MRPRILIEDVAPGYCRATFSNPPINLIDPELIGELGALVSRLETDPAIKVVVFCSADPDYFLAHYDVLADRARAAALPEGPTGMHPWLDVLARLSRAPAISIAALRGRARGAGSEFALACDMRFASREKAVLSQFEVGVGAVPGANPMVRLAGLMGRGRTLEVVLCADDFGGALAAEYGYVNRALADGDLDAFVDDLARRLASFEKLALAETKRLVDQATLPDDGVFPPALDQYFRSTAQPGTRQRLARLVGLGLQQRSELELNLGRHVAGIGG